MRVKSQDRCLRIGDDMERRRRRDKEPLSPEPPEKVDTVKDSRPPTMIARDKILESNRKRKEEKAKRKELIRVVEEEGREERKAVQRAWEEAEEEARLAAEQAEEEERLAEEQAAEEARLAKEADNYSKAIRDQIYGKWNQNGIWAHPHCGECGKCGTNSSSHDSGHRNATRTGYRSSSCQHD